MNSIWPRIEGILEYFDAKRLSILIGAILSVAGSAGQFFFIETLAGNSRKLEEARSNELAKIETLKAAQLQYFFAYQQGSILFAMDPNGTTRDKEVLSGLYQLNVINRALPLKSMLGELAFAGAIPFRETVNQYNAVNEAARKDYSWANYVALNEFEKSIVERALDQQNKLQERVFSLRALKDDLDDAVGKRKLFLVLMTLIGSGFLLIANLLTIRRH